MFFLSFSFITFSLAAVLIVLLFIMIEVIYFHNKISLLSLYTISLNCLYTAIRTKRGIIILSSMEEDDQIALEGIFIRFKGFKQ